MMGYGSSTPSAGNQGAEIDRTIYAFGDGPRLERGK
jgi:hypothetical protein